MIKSSFLFIQTKCKKTLQFLRLYLQVQRLQMIKYDVAGSLQCCLLMFLYFVFLFLLFLFMIFFIPVVVLLFFMTYNAFCLCKSWIGKCFFMTKPATSATFLFTFRFKATTADPQMKGRNYIGGGLRKKEIGCLQKLIFLKLFFRAELIDDAFFFNFSSYG